MVLLFTQKVRQENCKSVADVEGSLVGMPDQPEKQGGSMSEYLTCVHCGFSVMIKDIEKHVREVHFD